MTRILTGAADYYREREMMLTARAEDAAAENKTEEADKWARLADSAERAMRYIQNEIGGDK